MMKSPYLTDTVMLEVVNKEDVLNSVMVKDVMVANPQSAKSDEVMTELENRINPLPDYMIEEIEAGKDSIGEKERMEASKSYFRHQQAIHLNLLKQIYNFDKSNAGKPRGLAGLPRNLGMVTWLHGYMVTRLHGYMATWLNGYMATWLHGYMVTWLHGYMATWLHG